jgi:hypothetical protein
MIKCACTRRPPCPSLFRGPPFLLGAPPRAMHFAAGPPPPVAGGAAPFPPTRARARTRPPARPPARPPRPTLVPSLSRRAAPDMNLCRMGGQCGRTVSPRRCIAVFSTAFLSLLPSPPFLPFALFFKRPPWAHQTHNALLAVRHQPAAACARRSFAALPANKTPHAAALPLPALSSPALDTHSQVFNVPRPRARVPAGTFVLMAQPRPPAAEVAEGAHAGLSRRQSDVQLHL